MVQPRPPHFVGAMKIARNVAVFEWLVEWWNVPTSEFRRGDENRPPTSRFPGGMLNGTHPPAPSLRELLSAAKLRECRPLVASCQRFAQRFILTLKFLSGYVHRSTLPQSRIRSTAPSEREPGMGGTIHPGVRKPGGWRAIFIAPTKGLHHSSPL